MITLSRKEAIAAVRKNLDELGLGGTVMYNTESTDNEELDNIIELTLPDAINEVNLAAPIYVLEGTVLRAKYSDASGATKSDYINLTIDDKVISFSFRGPFLRLVSLRMNDTAYVVDGVLSENTPEARMQLNKYVRGTYDAPKLVLLHGGQAEPAFRYYSLKEDNKDFNFQQWLNGEAMTFPIKHLEYIPYVVYDEESEGYQIADVLRSAIINQLTGKVLSIYKNNDAAAHFYDAAKSMLQ